MRGNEAWSEIYAEWKSRHTNYSKEERGAFVRMCVGKLAHDHLLQAWAHANALPALKKNRKVTVYPCPICSKLHVGNQKTWGRNKVS